jgi:cyclase
VTGLIHPRLIARLDIKGPNLIKGVQLEGLRVLGDPREFAIEYYNEGIDELLYMDIVASLYGRNNLLTTVERTAEEVFVPLTVGGGIRSLSDVRAILNSGADKAIRNPRLLREIADTFGSQCVVLSVEAKRQQSGEWEAYTDNGRERTGRSVIEWISEATRNGVGEVLITSVDREGTRRGLDLDLLKRVHEVTSIPVIISGGFREPRNFSEAISAGADAVAVADALHFRRFSIDEIRSQSEFTRS